MRKNSPRKWLHAVLDLLPVILIPVFMIYSHRHEINTGSIEVPQQVVVDFNQLYNGSEDSSFVIDTYSISYDSDTHVFDLHVNSLDNTLSTALLNARFNYVVLGHKYLGRVIGDTANLIMYDGVNARGVNTFISPTGSYIGLQLYITPSSTPYDANFIYTLFDLTQMFGAGNEPTTLQQFNSLFPESYYDYTLSHRELINSGSIIYDDTDIMSQFTYQLYNAVDKYFNMGNVFNLTGVYDWFNLNIFNGSAPIYIYVVWQIVLYEFVMDLLFLLYGLFMWFIDIVQHLMDKPFKSIK